jgi:hypothetical protein
VRLKNENRETDDSQRGKKLGRTGAGSLQIGTHGLVLPNSKQKQNRQTVWRMGRRNQDWAEQYWRQKWIAWEAGETKSVGGGNNQSHGKRTNPLIEKNTAVNKIGNRRTRLAARK